MKNRFLILLSPAYVLALAGLLLNDFYLKVTFHNFLTGKLSDFLGLFVFAVFFLSLFGKYRKAVLWSIGALFVFWKSPLSGSVIDLFNSLSLYSIGRVVDYGDLTALLVLPLADWYMQNYQPKEYSSLFQKAYVPIFLLSVFSFLATSKDIAFNQIPIENKTYTIPYHLDSLYDRLSSLDSVFYNDLIRVEDSLNVTTPDTFSLTIINSDFCDRYYDARLTALQMDSLETTLNLFSFGITCEVERNTKQILLDHFEETVIDSLR